MKRVVVLCQPGRFGRLSARRVATRLARRLGLQRLVALEAALRSGQAGGWVTPTDAPGLSPALLGAADTVVWLHYSPAAVAGAWLHGTQERSARAAFAGRWPRLVDIADSFRHMLATPRLHQLLNGGQFAHLQVFCFRNPAQTDFWLRAQEHRLRRPPEMAIAQAA